MSRVSTSCASRQRRSHAQDRLVGEEHGPFRHRVDVAGEAQVREIVEQPLAESPAPRQPFELLRREMQALREIQRLFKAGGDQESRAGPAACARRTRKPPSSSSP